MAPASRSMRIVGPRTWKRWEKQAKALPCETCADEGVMLIRGSHDVVNVSLDKPVHDKPNFERFVGEVNQAAAKAGIGPETWGPSKNDYILVAGIIGFVGIVLLASR